MAAAAPRIGTLIKRARERRRWSQRQLAAALGVDRKTIDNWEHDRTHPRSSAGAIEAVLGISLDGGGDPAAGRLEPLDEWERRVLSDESLPPPEREEIVRMARDVRERLYPGLRLHPPRDGRDAARESRAG